MVTAPQGSTALYTDAYELTMLTSAIAEGIAKRPAVFECFSRRLPEPYRFGVVAGLGRALDAIEAFRFTGPELEWLQESEVIDHATAEWLDGRSFSGRITAYAEGELYSPGSPVLTVEAPLGEGMILETLLLSIINHDSAVATKAARIRMAAGERSLAEMGGRRTHEVGAVAAARAAWIAGFDATSNLAAGYRYGAPTMGTAAHAWTLAHEHEGESFDAQIAALGVDTTLLVDTYDIPTGIERAVDAARRAGAAGPGAIRLDSGDLALEAKKARRQLDDLGATDTRIVVSGDLDEFRIAEMATSPIDSYGVGTKLVSGLPNPGFVYKLVQITRDGVRHSVEKSSAGKHSDGGRKTAHRRLGPGGRLGEQITVLPSDDESRLDRPTDGADAEGWRSLQRLVWDGERIDRSDAAAARAHHAAVMADLPRAARALDSGEPAVLVHGP